MTDEKPLKKKPKLSPVRPPKKTKAVIVPDNRELALALNQEVDRDLYKLDYRFSVSGNSEGADVGIHIPKSALVVVDELNKDLNILDAHKFVIPQGDTLRLLMDQIVDGQISLENISVTVICTGNDGPVGNPDKLLDLFTRCINVLSEVKPDMKILICSLLSNPTNFGDSIARKNLRSFNNKVVKLASEPNVSCSVIWPTFMVDNDGSYPKEFSKIPDLQLFLKDGKLNNAGLNILCICLVHSALFYRVYGSVASAHKLEKPKTD